MFPRILPPREETFPPTQHMTACMDQSKAVGSIVFRVWISRAYLKQISDEMLIENPFFFIECAKKTDLSTIQPFNNKAIQSALHNKIIKSINVIKTK